MVCANTSAKSIMKFLGKHIILEGVTRELYCEQGSGFTSKELEFFYSSNNIKILFAPENDHRGIGLVERLIQTLKTQLHAMRLPKTGEKSTVKIAQLLAELIKTLRITPNQPGGKSPFEIHNKRKPNTPVTNITRPTVSDLKELEQPPLPESVYHNFDTNSELQLQKVQWSTPLKEVPKKAGIPRAVPRMYCPISQPVSN